MFEVSVSVLPLESFQRTFLVYTPFGQQLLNVRLLCLLCARTGKMVVYNQQAKVNSRRIMLLGY